MKIWQLCFDVNNYANFLHHEITSPSGEVKIISYSDRAFYFIHTT